MVEAKGTQTKTPNAKSASDKAKAEAASKSVKALAGKRKAHQKKKDNRPVFYGAAVVFVALLMLVVMGGMKKKAAGSLVKGVKSAAGAVTRKARKAGADSTATPRKKPSAPGISAGAQRRAPRAKGLRQRQPVASRPRIARATRASTDRTQRSKNQSGKQRTSPNTVSAIGEGSAMIGNRPVHVGDVIRGRVILEIGGDAVKVEYGGTIYTIRIGEALP